MEEESCCPGCGHVECSNCGYCHNEDCSCYCEPGSECGDTEGEEEEED